LNAHRNVNTSTRHMIIIKISSSMVICDSASILAFALRFYMLGFNFLLTHQAKLAHRCNRQPFFRYWMPTMVANTKEPPINAQNGFLDIEKQIPLFISAVKLNSF